MLKDAQGNLKIYSIGIVVEDKQRNSDTINVYPVEELPLANGNIKETVIDYDQTLPDSKNVPTQGKVEGKNYLQAKWLPFGHSNRITPPDVYANEHVILFRYADNDEYYWTTIYREPMFRRLETVCYMFSNLKEKMKEFTKESSYWCEISTHDGHIKVHTSKTNGEKFGYDIEVNGKAGYLFIKDDADNSITIDSSSGNILLNAKNVIINGENNITLKAGSLTFDSNGVNTGSSGKFAVESGTIDLTAENVNLYTGNVNCPCCGRCA